VFTYAPGRGKEHALELLKDFSGVVQCDGYGSYKALARRRQDIVLSHCWAHVRRDFIDLSKEGLTPIAAEALKRIAEFYSIDAEMRGRSPEERRSVRQARTKPLVYDTFDWLEEQLKHVPGRLKTAEVIRYVLNHREGLTRFLDDGRLELDNNTVERAIRPIALNRKNKLFAGGDEGGETWAILATFIECCKLLDLEPNAYLTDVVTRLINGHPQSRLAELTPWAWKAARAPN
jgi:transposase